MEFRLTQHARARMALRMISEEEIDAVLSAPDSSDATPAVIRYDRVVDGRRLRVIMKRDVDPPLVITAMLVEGE